MSGRVITRSITFHALVNAPLIVLIAVCSFLDATGSQQTPDPAEILSKTAGNGTKVIASLKEYSYYSELTLQTVNAVDLITGTYSRSSQVYFDPDGVRREKVFDDKSTLPEKVYIGTNAVNNLTHVYYFIVTPEILNIYEFNYVGKERIDELFTYVFDVKPRVKLPDPERTRERYLKGRVWIDDQDFQVVKVAGEALPEQSAHRTPKFETYFQNYGKYWFPAYASADDDVQVGSRRMRVIVKVRFTGYKKQERN